MPRTPLPVLATPVEGGALRCELCPRACKLREGQRGFCFVRVNRGGQIVLDTYGRSSGFAIDPIEKKPLNHFLPGSTALSFGTAGCNLACKFCQNWDISKSRSTDSLGVEASPAEIARAAVVQGCASVAFTYNDPIIFAEYAVDTAWECREVGVAPVVVSAGYISAPARKYFFEPMLGANIDLKAFDDGFYWKLASAHLRPILETLVYVREHTQVWLEVTNLVIPGFNDSPAQIRELAAWILRELGAETPLHLSAFHPAFKMVDVPRTSPETLAHARAEALDAGLRHVYTGNIYDPAGQTTFCAGCGEELIGRDRYTITSYRVTPAGTCPNCGHVLAGFYGHNDGKIDMLTRG